MSTDAAAATSTLDTAAAQNLRHNKFANCDKPRLMRVDDLGFWQCVNCEGYYYSAGGKIEGPMTRASMLKKKAELGEQVEGDGRNQANFSNTFAGKDDGE